MSNSFGARDRLIVNDTDYEIFRLGALSLEFDLDRLPFSLKILLENLLRHEDGVDVTVADIEALAGWDPNAQPSVEIAFTPSRVLLQDFTGVPALVDLAAMRDAMLALGGDPSRINPLSPVELVIDHSVQVDVNARPDARLANVDREYERNAERYAFLRWGQTAFKNFKVVPPGTGIVHQVNLEHLARVVFARDNGDGRAPGAYPDTVVGTDSHTTMINGIGVLGWGVGGIEAEAAMLGQPISMLIPQVVGFRLHNQLSEGATATDLVLTVVQMLRERGVVGKFVEFFGDGLDHLPVADRATVANMAPEYGATCGMFPIDQESLRYLRLTGRGEQQVALIEAYAREQGLFRLPDQASAHYSDLLELDLASVVPSLAGPKRPQDRIVLSEAKAAVRAAVSEMGSGETAEISNGESFVLKDADVVIAAITSCTNTSNPAVMVAAGLLAQKAHDLGLKAKPWVKTSLAPGSLVVKDYLERAGLMDALEALGFHIVGFGCTTCIGNSGPLAAPISAAIRDKDLAVSAVLSGNRNFEGRVHAEVKMNFLASPPLVVAYALAGTTDIDLLNEPLGTDSNGKEVFLRDVWPGGGEIQDTLARSIDADMFATRYASVFEGDDRWRAMPVPTGERYQWDITSTYVQNPPYFEGITREPPGIPEITGARSLALLGNSITTDHISPAGAIKTESPAGHYLVERQVAPGQFNSYGSRRGNHQVMMRGTFANNRLRNLLAPGTEGGWTIHYPSGEQLSIFDAAMRYQDEGVPLVIIGGSEYGTGSSRDWAAKGTLLLGVKAVLVKSFERIHRSNLVGMGVLPLQFDDGEDADSLGLEHDMCFDIEGLEKGCKRVTMVARKDGTAPLRFEAVVRIDTPKEWDYYEHGGILHYVLRQLAG